MAGHVRLSKLGSGQEFSTGRSFRLGGCWLGNFATSDERLHPPFQFASRQEDSPLTPLAFDSDVGAKTVDLPIETAARMGFAQANDIADPELEWAVLVDGHRNRRTPVAT